MQDKLCTIAALAFAALLGCDAPDNDLSFRVVPIGYWTDGDDGCSGYYLKTESGSMCLPPCNSAPCQVPQVDECGHQVGFAPTCLSNDFCAYSCSDDGDCITGQRCDGETDLCVWENMPPVTDVVVSPGDWGSCSFNDWSCAATQCRDSESGSFCSPTCVHDADCTMPPTNECSEDATAICVDGTCKIPCDTFGGCWGVDGMTCDTPVQQCVWAS